MKLIKKGSNGEKVREIQKHLDLTVDGIFGDKTERSHLRKYTRITFLFFDTKQLSHAAIAITSKSAKKTFSLRSKT